MAIKSGKIASVADGGDTAKIQPSDVAPMVAPSSPAQDDIWFDISGSSPSRTIALKVYDNGAWRTLISFTY